MFCMNCGEELPDKAKFCFSCGKKIESGIKKESGKIIKKTENVLEPDDEIIEIRKESKMDSFIDDIAVKTKTNTGKSYYESGELLYEGEFKEDKLHGKGALYYEDGKLWYEGEFKEDKCHGKGKEYYESGELWYEGEFKEDMWHGKGNKYYKNGKMLYEGELIKGNLHGKGKLYYENGELCYEGNWKDGKRLSFLDNILNKL